jgi:WD40-like Beta Propeller Repeat
LRSFTLFPVITILFICLLSPKVKADDPSIKWKSITSKNFKIVFPQKYRKIAGKVGYIAEKAHNLLSPFMGWKPTTRTNIVLSGYTDAANGSATVYFRKTIQIYLTFPEDVSELADFDDWLWVLILHEYTHILHMDTKSRLPRLINKIFGQLWIPNSILPTWVLESLAVYSETKYSTGGRNRASLYNMQLRTSVLQGKFLTLADISSAPIPYPRGVIPYLYGSRFLWFLTKEYGDDNIKFMTAAYGSKLVPFGINKSAIKSFGKSFELLYKEFSKALRLRYAKTKLRVTDRGIRKGQKITKSGEFKFYPSFHPKKSNILAYVGHNGASPVGLKLLHLNKNNRVSKKTTLKTRLIAPGFPSWRGESLMHHGLEVHDLVYVFNDIYITDFKSKNSGTIRLTKGSRLSSPSPCPLSNNIIAVRSRGIASDLVLLNSKGKILKILDKGKNGSNIHTPRYSRKGNLVTYSIWQNGNRDIIVYDLKSGKKLFITADRALDVDPHFSPNDKYVLFSSDRTGIFNIYAYEMATQTLFQVTNLISGAFAPSVSANGKLLAYAGYSTKGYDIYLMEFNKSNFLPALPYIPTKMPPSHLPEIPSTYQEKDYSALSFMKPVAWFADYGYTKTSAFSASFYGFDLLNHHVMNVFVSYAPGSSESEAILSYRNTSTWFPLDFRLSTGQYQKTNMRVNDTWMEYPWTYAKLEGAVSVPLIRSFKQTLNSYVNTSVYKGSPSETRPVPRPDSTLPLFPDSSWRSSIKVGGYYFNGTSSTDALEWEKGVYVSAYSEALFFSYQENPIYNFRFETLLRTKLPFGKHTVISGRLNLGSSKNYNNNPFKVGGSNMANRALYRPWSDPMNLIHGFPSYEKSGDHYYSANMYVTFPIKWLGVGYSTLPFYFRRISAKLFFDVGDALDSDFSMTQPLLGMGGELRIQIMQGYIVGTDLVIGVTKGMGEHGEWGWYFALGSPLPETAF